MELLLPRSSLFPYTTLFRSRPALKVNAGFVFAYAVSTFARPTGSLVKASEVMPFRPFRICSDGVPSEQILKGLKRSEEHTSELQSLTNLVCRLLLEKKHERGHGHPRGVGQRRRAHRPGR